MRHGCAYRQLSRNSEQRGRLLRHLATHLFEHERIQTTLPRAKELRRFSERLITLAKRTPPPVDSLRQTLYRPTAFNNLLGVFRDRYAQRAGGYVRVWRAGYRKSDKAPIAIVEMVGNPWDMRVRFTKAQEKASLPTLQYPQPIKLSNKPPLK